VLKNTVHRVTRELGILEVRRGHERTSPGRVFFGENYDDATGCSVLCMVGRVRSGPRNRPGDLFELPVLFFRGTALRGYGGEHRLPASPTTLLSRDNKKYCRLRVAWARDTRCGIRLGSRRASFLMGTFAARQHPELRLRSPGSAAD